MGEGEEGERKGEEGTSLTPSILLACSEFK